MAPAEFVITPTIILPGSNRKAATAALRRWVAHRGGQVLGEPRVRPTSTDLLRLPLPSRHQDRIIARLVDNGVESLDTLTDHTEEQVLKFDGIGWCSYLQLVRALAQLKLRLKHAPDFEDMLELLDIPQPLYLDLRSSKDTDRNWHIPRHRTFRTISEVTELDYIGLTMILGGVTDLVYQLSLRNRYLAPMYTDRTIADLYTTPYGDDCDIQRQLAALVDAGVDPQMRLLDLTAEYLLNLVGKVGRTSYITYLDFHLRDVGIMFVDDPFGLAEAIRRRATELGVSDR